MHSHDFIDQRIIENGSFVPHYTENSLQTAIMEVVQLIQQTISNRTLKIVVDEMDFSGIDKLKFDKRRLQ